MAHPFFTIGHSTRAIDEFVELLRIAGVTQVVDVRTVPRSRTNPQYNRDVLGETLAGFRSATSTSPRHQEHELLATDTRDNGIGRAFRDGVDDLVAIAMRPACH